MKRVKGAGEIVLLEVVAFEKIATKNEINKNVQS